MIGVGLDILLEAETGELEGAFDQRGGRLQSYWMALVDLAAIFEPL